MTTFRRKNPVNPGYHMVTRDEWGRSSHAGLNGRELSDWVFRYLKSHDFEDTRRLFDENASCPECGDSVYFFRHENGGCVWFDEVPWPWTKHGCMDIKGTKASTQSYNKQLKIDERVTRAREAITEQRKAAFAGLFFQSEYCSDCKQKEFLFHLTTGAECRFKTIGDSWTETSCNRTADGNLYAADGYEYLESHLAEGGKWKVRVPAIQGEVPSWAARYPWTTEASLTAHFARQNSLSLLRQFANYPFSVDAINWRGVIPCENVASIKEPSGSWLYLLRSVLVRSAHVIVRGGHSSALRNSPLAFLRIATDHTKPLSLSYLCLNTGTPRKLSVSVVAWDSIIPSRTIASSFVFPSKSEMQERLTKFRDHL